MKKENQIVEKWNNFGMMDDISSYSQKYILANLMESLSTYMINIKITDRDSSITETIIFPTIYRIFINNPHTLIFFTPEKYYINLNIEQNIDALKILYPNNNTKQKLTDYIVEKFIKEGYEQL